MDNRLVRVYCGLRFESVRMKNWSSEKRMMEVWAKSEGLDTAWERIEKNFPESVKELHAITDLLFAEIKKIFGEFWHLELKPNDIRLEDTLNKIIKEYSEQYISEGITQTEENQLRRTSVADQMPNVTATGKSENSGVSTSSLRVTGDDKILCESAMLALAMQENSYQVGKGYSVNIRAAFNWLLPEALKHTLSYRYVMHLLGWTNDLQCVCAEVLGDNEANWTSWADIYLKGIKDMALSSIKKYKESYTSETKQF